MKKVSFKGFYFGGPIIQPIAVEKYYLDEGRMLDTRQMTYSFIDESQKEMEPTFEVNDVVLHQHDDEPYVIERAERFANEFYVERLDSNLKRTGKFICLEDNEMYHKLKDVEWI